MNSQVTFLADKSLKDKAMKKAKEKGLSLKSVLVFSMQAFVDDKIDFGIISDDDYELEEIKFDSESINENAAKLAMLLS